MGLSALGLLLGGAPVARAQCPANGPGATGTPSVFWGRLQPTDVGTIPDARDTTEYSGGAMTTDSEHPLFSSIDVEGGYAFTSFAFGFHVWDATGPNAADPKLLATREQWNCRTGQGQFLVGIPCQEQRWLIWDVDAPPEHSNLVAVSGIQPFGVSIWDASNKSAPKALYQDTGRNTHQVFATTIGGRHYAFGASSGSGNGLAAGLTMYDMSAAKELYGSSTGCDGNSADGVTCGVLTQTLTSSSLTYVDGFTAGGRTFVVASGGPGDNFDPGVSGVRLWEVTNPSSPQERTLGGFTGQLINGIAVWQQSNRQFLAVQPYGANARIHEISGCLDSGCASAPTIWTASWPAFDAIYHFKDYVRWVTYSQGGDGTGYLYFGTEHLCVDGVQGEWLYDLSNLTTTGPEEMTPTATQTIDGKLVGYWSHYYPTRSTGFNRVQPRVGKVYANHFYRAAWTLFDVHKLVDVDPTITVTGPASGYAGSAAEFQASASSCTPDSQGWGWSTDGATGAGTSAIANLTWSTTGLKTVSANNTGCSGAIENSAQILILDPSPAVGSVSASPASPFVCQPVTLTANDVTGQPPLTYSWTVVDGALAPAPGFASDNLNPIVWNIPAGTNAGAYTATVNVSGVGSPASSNTVINVQALPALPGAGAFAPTNDPFTAGTVQFHVNVPGATEWDWDFGDGAGYTGWTNDPISGPNPIHSYTSIGFKLVKVKIRNCVEGERESDVLTVEITQVAPLEIDVFQATSIFCFGGGCSAGVGEAITFTVDTGGDPTGWFIEWGDGSSTGVQAGAPPAQVQHTYGSAATYSPKLTITRGVESVEKVHTPIAVSPAQPPSIGVSGPSSGQVGQSLTFSATASNCSASANGWEWTATGVAVTDTDNSITVSFPSAGSKNVTAKNSACGNAQGQRSVSITQPGGGGGGGGSSVKANFTFSPAAPLVGQVVTFDGSSSTGSSLSYFWEFGDGSTAITQVATHAFTEAQAYQVRLSILACATPSPSCPSDSLTKTVIVGGPSLTPTFETSAECTVEGGLRYCLADTGEQVTFTGTTVGATEHEWDFGDGATATGKDVTHAWRAPGPYSVSYTASSPEATATLTRAFVVSGEAPPAFHTVMVPLISQADSTSVQAQTTGKVTHSDLFVFNPNEEAVEAEIVFRKRGLPDPSIPIFTGTIAPRATLYAADVLKNLFQQGNMAGAILVTSESDLPPVVTSYNTTVLPGGGEFGQTVQGVPLGAGVSAPVAVGNQVQHLVGLSDNAQRRGQFGISNAGDQAVPYRLRFFDSAGDPIGTPSGELVVSGQKLYRPKEIHDEFGFGDVDDYRVEIEHPAGAPLVPFGAVTETSTEDPSYLGPAATDQERVYLLGMISKRGIGGSDWSSDVLVANLDADDVSLAELTFSSVGVAAAPTDPVELSLLPGESLRLADLLATEWGLQDVAGVVTVQSDNPDGVFPAVQGSSYDRADPSRRFGQTVVPLSDADAAGAGESMYLIGLRQDAAYRTVFWVFNPGEEIGEYTLVYRRLDGSELSRETFALGAGVVRAFRPSQHPAAIDGRFVVHLLVDGGKALAAAQVVNNASNDPAYVRGERR